MNPRSIVIASLLALSLIGCGMPELPPPSQQVIDLTKERDRERAARVEAESARQQADSRTKVIAALAVVGGAGALFLGIALGSSVRRRSLRRDDE